MKRVPNYPNTRKAVSSLYQAEDTVKWIKKVIKVSSINHRTKLSKDPRVIEVIRDLNESVKKISGIEGYFIFHVTVSIVKYLNDENSQDLEYSLWCNYARLPKTASIFSWIVLVDNSLDNLIDTIKNNKNDIIRDIEDIIRSLNAPQKTEKEL